MVGLGHCHLLYRITCGILINNCTEWVPIAQSIKISTLQYKYNQILVINISASESYFISFVITKMKSVEHNVAPVVHLLVESERFSCHVLASLKPALNGRRLTERPAVWQSGHTAPFWSGSPLWQDTGSVKHGWQQLPVCGRRVTLGEVLFWGGHSVSACGGD